MTAWTATRRALMRVLLHEDVNFLLTNRLPRRLVTRAVGRIARVEHPWVARPAIALWRFFSGADLTEADDQAFPTLRAAFVRRLRPGARSFSGENGSIASPCDAILGAHGTIEGCAAWQVKGFRYRLDDLIPDRAAVDAVRDGRFATLRLTAGMYHRFHAPADLTVEAVTYLSGDCWNVNPIALRRVARLFCRNERAVIETRLADGTPLVLVAVAAILVAGIRLTFLDTERLLREGGSRRIVCGTRLARGEEMGWFEHGSTILVFADARVAFVEGLAEGASIRAGSPLMTDGSPGGAHVSPDRHHLVTRRP